MCLAKRSPNTAYTLQAKSLALRDIASFSRNVVYAEVVKLNRRFRTKCKRAKMILKTEKIDCKSSNMHSELVKKHPVANWAKLVQIQSRTSTYLME